MRYNIIAQTTKDTVVTQYEPQKTRSDQYQGESELQNKFVNMLLGQGYEQLNISKDKNLKANLRTKLEQLNSYKFTDQEWKKLYNYISNPNEGITQKTRKIQEDNIFALECDNGSTKNIMIIDTKNAQHNSLQLISQNDNRHDVTILVNGLPLVYIELNPMNLPIKEAFNRIKRYQPDNIWEDNGLYNYVQIFVISNGKETKYYSNTTRLNSISKGNKGRTSNSFEFTMFWSDSKNNVIFDLIDFTSTFLARHTILNVLTQYCIFTSEDTLMVMRPYQITATERIINRIKLANSHKKYGTVGGGGYIWHTTGSGKTLTSFQTAKQASQLSFIDKVIFIVDRKDLDYQTMKEYDKFEKGAANSNTSTAVLKRQLEDVNTRIIITTIQKLSNFVKANLEHDVYNKHVVMIFDECHRSQFGRMNTNVTKRFKKYYMFGFTGTPIFKVNSIKIIEKEEDYYTTARIFGDQLHEYTIINAINDKNVLPFHVDYVKTMEMDEDIEDEEVLDIDRESVMEAPQRIKVVTEYILNHFDQKTYRKKNRCIGVNSSNIREDSTYQNMSKKKSDGFNSIFAVASISMAKKYYKEFKKQMKESPDKKLKIATIFSYGKEENAINAIDGSIDEENLEDTSNLSQESREFLECAIKDYNEMFKTSFDTSSEKFQNYYKDVSMRMKNNEIDLLIVVNMFLTGFDATTLNTLWVDKSLRMHGLIQAFSRTNRILNSVKQSGNVVCFRNLKRKVDDAISIYGNNEAKDIVIMKTFDDYYNGYQSKTGKYKIGYVDLVQELKEKFPLSCLDLDEKDKMKNFLRLFGTVIRKGNILETFDEFKGREILTRHEWEGYCKVYYDLYEGVMGKLQANAKIADISDDVIFETELLSHSELGIGDIIYRVQKYKDNYSEDIELLGEMQQAIIDLAARIESTIDSSSKLRSKKDLIRTFIKEFNDKEDLLIWWREVASEGYQNDVSALIKQEKLAEKEARRFIDNCVHDGEVKTTGTDIAKMLPPLSRFGSSRQEKKRRIICKITELIKKYGDA